MGYKAQAFLVTSIIKTTKYISGYIDEKIFNAVVLYMAATVSDVFSGCRNGHVVRCIRT